jgi:hypothetical protein
MHVDPRAIRLLVVTDVTALVVVTIVVSVTAVAVITGMAAIIIRILTICKLARLRS